MRRARDSARKNCMGGRISSLSANVIPPLVPIYGVARNQTRQFFLPTKRNKLLIDQSRIGAILLTGGSPLLGYFLEAIIKFEESMVKGGEDPHLCADANDTTTDGDCTILRTRVGRAHIYTALHFCALLSDPYQAGVIRARSL